MATAGVHLPYVDAFKLCHVDKWPKGDFAKVGNTHVEVDREVGRLVVRLSGATPAATSLQLPQSRAGSLGLSGRFVYIVAQLGACKTYAIHVEFVTADKCVHRLSISNLCKQDEMRMKRGGVHIYMPASPDDAWLLLALDMHTLAQQGFQSAFSEVKSLVLAGNMSVRTVFCSSIKYNWQSLPQDLSVSAAFDTQRAKVVWMPEEPTKDVHMAVAKKKPALPLPAVPKQGQLRKGSSSCGAPGMLSSRQAADEEPEAPGLDLQPQPIMQLQHLNAFSGEFSRSLLWARNELVFPAGSTIVAMQASGTQRHLQGHMRPVVALALDATGGLLVSAEEGGEAAIKLWDLGQGKCLATVCGHAGGVCCLDVSPDGNLLVSAGLDALGKQVVVLSDVSQCRAGGKATELARHVTDYNIKCIKFVPFEPDKIVACGKNAIRVFRVKDGQLRGVSIPMDGVQALRKPYSCGTLADPACAAVGEVFTDIAFEHNPQLAPVATRRTYVATFSGAVYQVIIDLRAVEAVYQLHSAAIHSIAVRHGFCITACSQGMLRMWSLDFGDMYMEAQLEGPVTGVAFSADGLQVAAGTEVGSIGILSITTHKYATLLRSHIGTVHAIAVEPSGQQFYTASADGTVRAWDAATRQQLLEFFAPGETVLCIACHPSKAEVACGFESGAVRVFDVAAASMAQECRQHTGPVRQVVYAQRGYIMLSTGDDGTVCAYDARRAYLPIKYMPIGPNLSVEAITVSMNGQLIAAASRPASGGQCSITLFNAASLDPTLQFPVSHGSQPTAITQLHFLPDAQHILAITADSRLLGYSCHDGSLAVCVPRLHAGQCTGSALDKSATFLVTGGTDRLVKVWGLHALHQLQHGGMADSLVPNMGQPVKSLPCQAFPGHPDAVLGVAFLSSGQVLTVGTHDALLFWSFLGQRCNAYPPAPQDSSCSTVVIAPVKAASAPAPNALPDLAASVFQPSGVEQQADGGCRPTRPAREQQRMHAASSPSNLGKAGGAGERSSGCAQPRATAAGIGNSARKRFGKQEGKGPYTLRVTAACEEPRQAQLVPKHQQLIITAPETGSKAGREVARSAEWAWCEAPGMPECRSGHQLMPPTAAVQHVYGFSAAAGFAWDATAQQVVYAAGTMLILDDLQNTQRKAGMHVGSEITAMASSITGRWHAAAVLPAESGGADIIMYDAGSPDKKCILQCHQTAVKLLCPSPDGLWLVSVGCFPEPMALWDASTGELVAVGQLEAELLAVTWLPGAKQPTFYTVTAAGLSQWVLSATAMTAEQLLLPEAMQSAQLQAATCSGGQHADGGSSLALGDSQGRVWAIQVSATQDIISFSLLAELQEESVTAVHATANTLAIGTSKGTIAVLQQQDGTWQLQRCHQLDGRVFTISAQPDSGALLAATGASTLWLLHNGSANVLLCGHRHQITGMQNSHNGLVVTSSLAGVHVWQMEAQGGNSRAPLVEFCEPAGASCVSAAPNQSCFAAGYPNGSVCVYDLHTSSMRWRAVTLQPHPVVGVAVLHRLRAIRVMVVYRNGAIYLLDGSTGSVLQHTLQYIVTEPAAAVQATNPVARRSRSQNTPVTSLAVCPTDSSLFALLGSERVVVCKASWAKQAGCQTLSKLQPPPQGPDPTAHLPVVAFSLAHAGHIYCAFPSQQPTSIQLQDCTSGSIVKTILVAASGGITALAVGPSDKLLAAGTASGMLLLMRGATEAWSELAGHGSPVQALAFSACGTKLYSMAGKTVFVWDIHA